MLGLQRAMQRRGLVVQPFKCGADYADVLLHGIAGGKDSVNLDTWMASRPHVQYVYNTYAERADVCLTDGSMGLFDGYSRQKGSSAEIAGLLNVPVIMVVNARTVGYSAAPLLYGFKHFSRSVRIVGVVFNQISSEAHFAALREACHDSGTECLGYLPASDGFRLPARHSALTVEARKAVSETIERLADAVEKTVDVDKLLRLCVAPFPCAYTLPYHSTDVEADPLHTPGSRKWNIAVARDPAFCFLYKENLDRLSTMGQLSFFSPVYGGELPKADLVYLPGGYPELFARQLHRRKHLMRQLADYVERGGRVLAEDGGMVLLSRSLAVKPDTTPYTMAGVLPFDFVGTAKAHAEYRKTESGGVEFRGYESRFTAPTEGSLPTIVRYRNVVAGYTRWYWGEKDLLRIWE